MTEMIPRPKRKYFAGRVIDGPLEGEFIECDDPYFIGSFVRPPVAFYTGLHARAEFDNRILYRWLSSYRAWVWCQK